MMPGGLQISLAKNKRSKNCFKCFANNLKKIYVQNGIQAGGGSKRDIPIHLYMKTLFQGHSLGIKR